MLLGAPANGANAAIDNSEEARVADVLQSALVAHGAEVNRCFERALADTLDVAGKIELSVDVGPGGKVTHAEPAVDEVKSPVLLACLQATALTWTLSGIDPGSTVVVPLAFEGQAAQFSIKVADAPEHGPPAPPASKHHTGSPPPVPPFSVKLLVDEATMRAQKAAMAQLTVAPANRIALHKHPGAEVLYVLKGHARVLGGAGVEPEKLDEGMAVFIPGGMPHAIENMGRQSAGGAAGRLRAARSRARVPRRQGPGRARGLRRHPRAEARQPARRQAGGGRPQWGGRAAAVRRQGQGHAAAGAGGHRRQDVLPGQAGGRSGRPDPAHTSTRARRSSSSCRARAS